MVDVVVVLVVVVLVVVVVHRSLKQKFQQKISDKDTLRVHRRRNLRHDAA